jgi:hypothetical protein
MPHLIEQNILVGLDEADVGVVQMLRNPLGIPQNFRMGVLAYVHDGCLRIRAGIPPSFFAGTLQVNVTVVHKSRLYQNGFLCHCAVLPDFIWTVQAVKYDSAKLTLPYDE